MQQQTIFITATDTGAGKTVLTGLLLAHLLDHGVDALAMKPFCTGSREDVNLLQAIQGSRLPDQVINPFYFEEPVAPLVAARNRRHPLSPSPGSHASLESHPRAATRKSRQPISLAEVLQSIRVVHDQCECLLIEGIGGLMVPLGAGYFVADLIERLKCPVLVVAPNRLGTLNHTILTVNALHRRKKVPIQVVLRGTETTDFSTNSNLSILAETLAPVKVLPLPFLGAKTGNPEGLKINAKKVKKVLASLLTSAKVLSFF